MNREVKYLKRFSIDETLVVLISSSGIFLNINNTSNYIVNNSIKCFRLAVSSATSILQGALNLNQSFQLNSTNYNVIELLYLAVLADAVEELVNMSG